MKISKISKTDIQTKTQRQKIDMTGFDAEPAPSQETSITSKKASDAIKNSFLSNVSFGGHKEEFSTISSGYQKNYIWGTSGAVHTRLSDPLKDLSTHSISMNGCNGYHQDNVEEYLIRNSSSFYPNSSIENIKNNHRDYETHRAYFADPEEVIDDAKRRDFDFIVYDNRPKYPRLEELKKNYFFDNAFFDKKIHGYWWTSEYEYATNYGEYFDTIREYYERLEAADVKEYFNQKHIAKVKNINNDEKIGYYGARLEQSRHQQKLAEEARNIFNESAHLFMEKDDAKKKVKFYKDEIRYIPQDIENTQKSIELRMVKIDKLDKYIETEEAYIKMRKEYYIDNPIVERDYYSTEEELAKKNLKAIDEILKPNVEQIETLKKQKEEIEKEIASMKEHIATQESRLYSIREDLPKAEQTLNGILSTLANNYKKMEDFYNKNIQEWQYN